jgi:methionyl aminopeptidase
MFMEKSVEVKSKDELATMRQAGAVVADILVLLSGVIKPGMTTGEIDRIAREELKKRGAKPAFLNYHGFPGVICLSINAEVVHGIPSDKRKLSEGDIIGVDFGCVIDRFYGDSAVTDRSGQDIGRSGEAHPGHARVAHEGHRSREGGRSRRRHRRRRPAHAEAEGYGVVREFVGHGIGRALHEEPPIPNYGKAGTGPRLKAGMTIAIEPMINLGGADVETLGDGWTAVTKDRKLSAHFEHTIAVTETGFDILTLPSKI